MPEPSDCGNRRRRRKSSPCAAWGSWISISSSSFVSFGLVVTFVIRVCEAQARGEYGEFRKDGATGDGVQCYDRPGLGRGLLRSGGLSGRLGRDCWVIAICEGCAMGRGELWDWMGDIGLRSTRRWGRCGKGDSRGGEGEEGGGRGRALMAS